jgi:hypothetical protein
MLTDDIRIYPPEGVKYCVFLPDTFISPAEDLFFIKCKIKLAAFFGVYPRNYLQFMT